MPLRGAASRRAPITIRTHWRKGTVAARGTEAEAEFILDQSRMNASPSAATLSSRRARRAITPLPISWRILVASTLLLTVLAGCGGDRVSVAIPPSSPAAAASPSPPTLTLETAGSALPATVTHFSVRGADASGATVFGPLLALKAPSVVIGGLPPSMVTLEVSALDGDRPVATSSRACTRPPVH